MLDLGDMIYRNQQHKKRYEQCPEKFEICCLTFTEDGKLIRGNIKKTGQVLWPFELERLARELGVELSQ